MIFLKEGLIDDAFSGAYFQRAQRHSTVLLSKRKERMMTKREKLLEEVFEAALQNDMTYFG